MKYGLIMFLIVGCVEKINNDFSEIQIIPKREYCYKGFLYFRFDRSVVPVFNKYGSPMRCSKENHNGNKKNY